MTYSANVLLQPLQRFPLVFQSVVYTAASQHFLACQKPIWTNPVIEIDHNNIHSTSLYQTAPIVIGIRIGVESATLNEEVYRELRLGGRVSWCIDI